MSHEILADCGDRHAGIVPVRVDTHCDYPRICLHYLSATVMRENRLHTKRYIECSKGAFTQVTQRNIDVQLLLEGQRVTGDSQCHPLYTIARASCHFYEPRASTWSHCVDRQIHR